ncbi:MAG: TetR/AcrR family transcriptional regulator [Acidobacteria bacterium]|uniref:TetR/AcrR family transcriptional regulator n=1 Tax=Candidatus Polarisedimenticola svalbardensis TaxID=2886004 RepID=A0A8J7C1I5_9BACT|nr:TetR/AcrR family transcriptional regulator [Candidatus Polarisedimenticola svalbardensis]
MSKGTDTRHAILDRAVALSSRIGLCGLTLGRLATTLEMSKSGLFAHFASKENLQLSVLERATESFLGTVVRPAFKAPRGEPRIRQLFENWLRWAEAMNIPGGCPWVQYAAEMDDQPGPVRDLLVEQQKGWMGILAECVRRAVAEGDFRKNLDCDQFAYELQSLMLGWHHSARLLGDPVAETRARQGFETLLKNAR